MITEKCLKKYPDPRNSQGLPCASIWPLEQHSRNQQSDISFRCLFFLLFLPLLQSSFPIFSSYCHLFFLPLHLQLPCPPLSSLPVLLFFSLLPLSYLHLLPFSLVSESAYLGDLESHAVGRCVDDCSLGVCTWGCMCVT